jgi:hypothetical protein
MIRILVMVLLAANLLYFGWSQWLEDEQPRLLAPAPAPAPEPAAPSSPAADTATAQACTSVGPLREEAQALEIEQILRDTGLAPVIRSSSEELREGWWVYVASNDAPSQARALRAMQDAGLEEAFAMQDDPEHRISAGLLPDQAGAEALAATLRRLRLTPTVTERVEAQTVFWIDLPGTVRELVNLGRLEAEGVDLQRLRLEACPQGEALDIEQILPDSEPTPQDATANPGTPAAAAARPQAEPAV